MLTKGLQDRIDEWVRPEIRAIAAYHVPDAAGLIKLDAMENPYTWPEELRTEWLERLRSVDVNRYPHPQAPALRERLRESLGLGDGMELLLGNGSDELIQMIAMTLSGPGRCILSVEPGFVMYRMIALFAGMEYHGVPLRADDFGLDLPALLAAGADVHVVSPDVTPALEGLIAERDALAARKTKPAEPVVKGV